MADDEKAAFDRMRDRVGSLERVFERLDERMSGKLGQADATTLMDFASSGDAKLSGDFLARLGDFRIEVRESFKHNERETAAAIYKSTTESEAKIMAAIATLSANIASLSLPAEQRRGLHPVVPYGGGSALVVSAVWLTCMAMGLTPPGFG